MQVGQFSPVVATTVVLLFTFVCGVIGTPPLNRHLGVAEFPPHSEASLSQPTPLASRLKLLTDKIAVIYDRYSCALGVLGHKDAMEYTYHREVSNIYPPGFNSCPSVHSSSGNPSNHASQPSPVFIAWNNLLKKQTRGKQDARLPVEFRTRVFNEPKPDTTKLFAMAPLPEGIPGRELKDADLGVLDYEVQELIDAMKESITQYQKYPETAAAPDNQNIYTALINKLRTAKRRYSKFLSGKESSGVTGIQIFTSKVGIGNTIKRDLRKGDSILLIYCKENDFNTYYELIWERNDTKYSAEILMAYFARIYYYVTYISFSPRRNSKESEGVLNDAFKSSSANICGHGISDDAKIIFYTLQSLQISPT